MRDVTFVNSNHFECAIIHLKQQRRSTVAPFSQVLIQDEASPRVLTSSQSFLLPKIIFGSCAKTDDQQFSLFQLFWTKILTDFQNLILFDHIVLLKYEYGIVIGSSLNVCFQLKVLIGDVNCFYLEFSRVELVLLNRLSRDEFNAVSNFDFVLIIESDHMGICDQNILPDKASDTMFFWFLVLVVDVDISVECADQFYNATVWIF